MFRLDVDNSAHLNNAPFPTFEEALGILDLAERRKESLKEFDLENMSANSNRIRFIRQYLVMLMASVLRDTLEAAGTNHLKLVHKLCNANLLQETTFINTNYDILIDNALTQLYFESPKIYLDYGVDFTNPEDPSIEGGWMRPQDPAARLYKVHGSLNWLFCPTCNGLELTVNEKGIMRLITDLQNCRCRACESVITPIIVPPTYFKDVSNLYLSQIWHKAEQALREAEHVIFCGYSLPDAGIHLKYLIKRAQTNRPDELKFTALNKKHDLNEANRFRRFLGESVNYTNHSFEDFASNPMGFMTWKPKRRKPTTHNKRGS